MLENPSARQIDEAATPQHTRGSARRVPGSHRDVYGVPVEDKNFLSSLKTASSHKFNVATTPVSVEPARARVTDQKLQKRLDFNTPPPSAQNTPHRTHARASEHYPFGAAAPSAPEYALRPSASSMRCTDYYSQATAASLRSTDAQGPSPANSLQPPGRSHSLFRGSSQRVGDDSRAAQTRFSHMLGNPRASGAAREVEVLQRDKVVELTRTNSYPVPQYVDVVRDVVVDVPIERIVEREVVEERFVERLVERTVEVPVEQVIEYTVDRVVERPVEHLRVVERPYERVVEVPFDVYTENIIFDERVIDIEEQDLHLYPGAERLPTEVTVRHTERVQEVPVYVENVIEREVVVPRHTVIEVPVDRVTERRVPVIVERSVPRETTIVREVDVPVENIVYKPVPYSVERPVFRENIVEVPTPVEVLVERTVDVPVERLVSVEVPVERVVPREVDVLVEVPVPVEELHEVPVEVVCQTELAVERLVPVAREKIIRKSTTQVRRQETPVERAREVLVPVPVPTPIARRVQRVKEKYVEQVVERPVYIERVTQRPVEVERVVEVQVEHVVERPVLVEKLVELPVVYESLIEKEVEVIVVRDVEVPVEKLVEVEVQVRVERPVYREVEVVEEYDLEIEREVFDAEEEVHESSVEVEDEHLAHCIAQRRQELREDEEDHRNLLHISGLLRDELQALQQAVASPAAQENTELLIRHANISSELICKQRNLDDCQRMQGRRSRHTETTYSKNPRAEGLHARLGQLIGENRQLIAELRLRSPAN